MSENSISSIALMMIIIVGSALSSIGAQTAEGSDAPTRADPVIDGTIGASEYEGHYASEDIGKFDLYWTTTGAYIFLGMKSQVTGYVSLGLDPTSIMMNADMIFGWVDGSGNTYVKDAYSTGTYGPHPEDTSLGGTNDIISYDGTESGGVTTIELLRLMSTGDAYDKKFVNGTAIDIIWAKTNTDDDWNTDHDDAGTGTITMDGTPPPPPPASSDLDGVITAGEYKNSTSFDSGNFLLNWNVSGPNITIAMKAAVTGWVSLGISPESMMQGADLLVGGSSVTGPYCEDHYATTTTSHSADADIGGNDDIMSFNATEAGGWTTVELKRALVTGDLKDKDIVIGTPLTIIWAVSSSDDVAAVHTARGYGTWRVDATPPPPPPPPPKSDFDGVISADEYSNVTRTDSDRFELYWNLNATSIDIGVRAQVTGYVSLGIDPTVQMKDADMVFGWVSSSAANAEDHYGNGFTTHMRDEDLGGTFDIVSYNGTENGGWTTFEFRRNLTTGDIYDRTIRTDLAFPLIWAVSDSDDPTVTHARRGSIMWNLSNATPPPPPPPPPPHESEYDGVISDGEYTNSTAFDSGRFELHWNVTGTGILLGIRAQATGWVALGIDPTDQMQGADLLIGGHDGSDPYAEDHYGNTPTGHVKDTILGSTDDIIDFNSTEAGGWTTLELRRNLTSSDGNDKDIDTAGMMTIIWACSDSDDPTAKHTRTGITTWKLNASVTPPPPPPPKNTTLDGIVTAGEYDDNTSFGGSAFVLHWSVNGSKIWMAMTGHTLGWVSIGFEPSVMMKDADMIFGWVGSEGPRVTDTYSTGTTGPHPVDTDLGGTNDILTFNGTESDGNTTIEFVRELNTTDIYDRAIPAKGAIDIVWALGGDDDPESTHTERGSGTLLLYTEAPAPAQGLDGIVSQGEYKNSATFDFDNFRVYWTIASGNITMAISARTPGWISIGFDPEDQMLNADVVLGWVESGKPHIIDAFSTGKLGPHPPDTHLGGTTDIHQFNGTEVDGLTTMEFIRQVSTADAYDKDIPTTGNLNIMWAYGQSDDFGETHSQRGFAVLTIAPGGNGGDGEPDLDGIISKDEYDFNGTFGEGLVEYHWKVDGDSIRFAMVGRTIGWVAIGIDHSQAMADSDMIFGWVTSDGTVHVADTYSTGPTGPHPLDINEGGTNDITSFGGKEVNGVTTIEFVRRLDTGDAKDNPIPANGTLRIIWAVGGSDSLEGMHTKAGYGTINIESGETSSEEALVLWPVHAIFMTLGTAGMIAATIVLYRRKWRHFFKFHMWIMAGSVIAGAVGLITGFIMVAEKTGVHLRVIHSWFGLLTLLVSLFALAIGYYFKYTKVMKHKKPTRSIHRYAGWAGAVMFLLTAFSGFFQALVLASETLEAWFISVMAVLILVLIGTTVFLVIKGRKKPVPPPVPPAAPAQEPVEAPQPAAPASTEVKEEKGQGAEAGSAAAEKGPEVPSGPATANGPAPQ